MLPNDLTPFDESFTPEPRSEPKPGYVFNSKGKQVSLKKAESYARYKARIDMHRGLNLLMQAPYDILKEAGIKQSDIARMARSIRQADKQQMKTFTTCPSCHKALTGRARRKDISQNKFTYQPCNICNADLSNQWELELDDNALHYISLHKMTLKEAKALVKASNPEIFL